MGEFANEAGRKAGYYFSQGISPKLLNGNYLIEVGGIKWEVPISNFKIGDFNSRYIPTAYPYKYQK